MFGIKGRQSSDHFRRGIVDGGLKAEVRNLGGHIEGFREPSSGCGGSLGGDVELCLLWGEPCGLV